MRMQEDLRSNPKMGSIIFPPLDNFIFLLMSGEEVLSITTYLGKEGVRICLNHDFTGVISHLLMFFSFDEVKIGMMMNQITCTRYGAFIFYKMQINLSAESLLDFIIVHL